MTWVNGVSQDDRTNTSKFSFGLAWFPTPTVPVLTAYGRDISVRHGPMQSNRVNQRLLKMF